MCPCIPGSAVAGSKQTENAIKAHITPIRTLFIFLVTVFCLFNSFFLFVLSALFTLMLIKTICFSKSNKAVRLN